MNEGRTVFAQLLDFLPKYEFDKCVARYHGNFRVRKLPTYEQLLVLAFAQLTWRESLRDVETCLAAFGPKLYHAGIRQPTARNTLAVANEKRGWRIFADLGHVLIQQATTLYADEPFRFELQAAAYALDSTTIDLCLSLFPWATFRRHKAAIHFHTLLPLQGNFPTVIIVSTGSVHDVNILDQLVWEAGSFYTWIAATWTSPGGIEFISAGRSSSPAPSKTSAALSTYFVNSDTVQFDEQYISANQAVALDSTVSPASMVVSNPTYNYTISGSGAFGGNGSLTMAGAGTLTLATPNTYTGGTVISNGAVIMVSGTALGSNGSTVNVKSGAVLDVNGTSNGTGNTYALTINGSGPSGGGVLIDGIATAATFYGSITLGSDSTIKENGATLTLGDSTHAVPITGNYVLTVGGPSGFLVDVYGNVSVGSIIKVDGGQLKLESANSFAGGLTVKNGNVFVKNAASFGTGTVTLLDTTGSGGAELGLGVNGNINNPMIVQAGSSGKAGLDNFGGPYTPVWAGNITLNTNLTLQTSGSAPTGSTSVSGAMSGPGGLVAASQYPVGIVKVYGTTTYTGGTYVTVGTPAMMNNASISIRQ